MMASISFFVLCILPLLYEAYGAALEPQHKSEHPTSNELDTIPIPSSHEDIDAAEWNELNAALKKRGWNNLQGGWGKRNNWNSLQGGWGKRSNWNNLHGGWGKRSNWNNLHGGWGKRNWNNLQGGWGKRDWNNLNGMWGKRGWNNLQGGWGKRVLDEADLAEESNKRTQWNNLRSMWGKRGAGGGAGGGATSDLALREFYEQQLADDYDQPML